MALSVQGIHGNGTPTPCDDQELISSDDSEELESQSPVSSKTHFHKALLGIGSDDASKLPPPVDSNALDLAIPDTQFPSSTSREISKKSEDMDLLLPDTQKNSTQLPVSFASSTEAYSSDHRLPDTQTNKTRLENKFEFYKAVSDSQLQDTQANEVNNTHENNDSNSHSGDFLLDTKHNTQTPPNALKRGSHAELGILMPDTQCNTFPINSSDKVASNPCSLLPDTQRDSDSDIQYFEDENDPRLDHLLPNTQFNTGRDTSTSVIVSNLIVKGLSYAQVSSNSLPRPLTPVTEDSLKSIIDDILASIPLSNSKVPLNKITCRERKRTVVSNNRPASLTKDMCQWIDKTNYRLDPFREDGECWFHPSPPSAHVSMNGILRPCGALQKRFHWRDRKGKHSLVLNFGVVSKLVNYKMTKQQKDGFINKQWHLSHLCGNWTCLNPAHTTVEPGNVNISCNKCFSHRSGCLHRPICMKDKKAALGADGRLVDHTLSILSEIGPRAAGDWDDWSMHGFGDDDESVVMDGFQDSESTASHQNGGDGSSISDVEGEDEQ